MSYVMRDNNGLDYIVARRMLDEEEDAVSLEPVYLIVAVPEGVDEKDVKDLTEKSGEKDKNRWNWREYKVVAESDWGEGKWEREPEAWAQELYWTNIEPCHSPPWVHATTYSELAERIGDERRITLRLPLGLHVALSRAAEDITLNSYCIKALADAVGFRDLVEEFEAQREAQRRKPGRPKKVQDAE